MSLAGTTEMTAKVRLDTSPVTFDTVSIDWLQAAGSEALDRLEFGVIGFNAETTVEIYNRFEAEIARIDPSRVKGRPVFLSVAPCMNNYLVSQRFEDEDELDTVLNYVLTLRMRPTPVKLRLLKSARSRLRFALVQR